MAAEPPASLPYTWKSVQIVGGGFVDGFVFHPTAKDLVYARTDIGGAYRRDPRTHRWLPLLDWVPYADLDDRNIAIMVAWRPRMAWFEANVPKLARIAERTRRLPFMIDVMQANRRN